MKELKAANLSQVYTNHCIRATAITLLSDAGLSNRHIMTLSGHRNENSLKSYNARPSSQRLQVCSNVLSSALNPEATQVDQQMQVFRGNQQQLQQSEPAACATIPNQQNVTRHDERFNFSTIFSGCQNEQVHEMARAIKHSNIHLEVRSLQHRECFELFVSFHRTLDISSKDLEGFKADIAFTYTALACSLALSSNLNLILL